MTGDRGLEALTAEFQDMFDRPRETLILSNPAENVLQAAIRAAEALVTGGQATFQIKLVGDTSHFKRLRSDTVLAARASDLAASGVLSIDQSDAIRSTGLFTYTKSWAIVLLEGAARLVPLNDPEQSQVLFEEAARICRRGQPYSHEVPPASDLFASAKEQLGDSFARELKCCFECATASGGRLDLVRTILVVAGHCRQPVEAVRSWAVGQEVTTSLGLSREQEALQNAGVITSTRGEPPGDSSRFKLTKSASEQVQETSAFSIVDSQ